MRFQQVRDIVDWAVDFHRRLAHQYAAMARQAEDERQRMALEYLAEHEHQMQRGLARYLKDDGEHRHVLDTWFSTLAEQPHPEVLSSLCSGLSCTSLDGLLSSALTIHKTLEDMWRHRADEANLPAESDFFTALAASHEAEVRRLARDMARLEAY